MKNTLGIGIMVGSCNRRNIQTWKDSVNYSSKKFIVKDLRQFKNCNGPMKKIIVPDPDNTSQARQIKIF